MQIICKSGAIKVLGSASNSNLRWIDSLRQASPFGLTKPLLPMPRGLTPPPPLTQGVGSQGGGGFWSIAPSACSKDDDRAESFRRYRMRISNSCKFQHALPIPILHGDNYTLLLPRGRSSPPASRLQILQGSPLRLQSAPFAPRVPFTETKAPPPPPPPPPPRPPHPPPPKPPRRGGEGGEGAGARPRRADEQTRGEETHTRPLGGKRLTAGQAGGRAAGGRLTGRAAGGRAGAACG